MPSDKRILVASLALSAAGLVGLVGYEGYTDTAVIPIPGDVPTLGFGSTEGVKLGDKTTPPKALARTLRDTQKHQEAIRRCVKVPLSQGEYDSATLLSYNIGPTAFCRSTVVKRFNALDYEGACDAFLMWDKASGKRVPGLTNRRQAERRLCLGLV